jgi:hypothetical protein
MNFQLHHLIVTSTGVFGTRIIRAIVNGEGDPDKLAAVPLVFASCFSLIMMRVGLLESIRRLLETCSAPR